MANVILAALGFYLDTIPVLPTVVAYKLTNRGIKTLMFTWTHLHLYGKLYSHDMQWKVNCECFIGPFSIVRIQLYHKVGIRCYCVRLNFYEALISLFNNDIFDYYMCQLYQYSNHVISLNIILSCSAMTSEVESYTIHSVYNQRIPHLQGCL